ncbi:MAG TPA: hypothetical protein PKN87_09140 [Syntrophomonadaceae bacterium]|nr:hypothetical protein [Syntrophomonadaceae bacterium]
MSNEKNGLTFIFGYPVTQKQLTRIIVSIVLLFAVLIVWSNFSSENQEIEESPEYTFEAGLNYLKVGDWNNACVAFVDEDNEQGKALYNYASAKEFWHDYNSVGAAKDYMDKIPEDYDGVLAEEVLAFKKECEEKYKAEYEIEPGSKKVYIGMTQEEAISSMGGKPYDINKTVGNWGTHEQWCYDGGIYLYFEDGLLTSWQY